MQQKARTIAIISVVLLVSVFASADSVWVGGIAATGGGLTTSVTNATIIDFNAGLPSGPGSPTYAGNFGLVTGSVPGIYAQPGTDTTQYISTPKPYTSYEPGGYSYTITFASGQTYFGLYWASIDNYNVIQFYNGGTLVSQLGGTAARTLAGGSDGYFNFNISGGYDQVKVSSSQYAFESDNHAYATPEPASLLLFGTGLSALALRFRRKRF